MASEMPSWKCLFCNETTEADKGSSSDAVKCLFGRDTYNKSKDDLESHMSIFFMLRKVLGLPTEFLEELLLEYGSPASWKVRLCRPCNRIFAETEYLWKKIKALQNELEKVSYEVKDLLVNSISSEEGDALLENADDLKAHKAVIKEQLKSHKVPITDTVRATFFLCLHEQSNDNEKDKSSKKVLECTGKPYSTSNSAKNKLLWNETGLPFLAVADFEKKIKDLGAAIDTLSKSATFTLEYKENSSKGKKKSQNEDSDNDDITILDEKTPKNKPTAGPSVTIPNTIPISNPPSTPLQVPPENHEEEVPDIRIVQTSSLMESEDSEDEDETESVPRVIGVMKRDIDCSEETDDITEDPLAINDDHHDPDYRPDESQSPKEVSDPGMQRRTSSASDPSVDKINPESYPSKLKSVKIKPVRKGENFECSKCNAEFEARSGCLSHILKDHYGDKAPFHCHICRCKFELVYNLTEHVSKRHGQVRTPYDNDFNPETDYIGFSKPIQEKESESSSNGEKMDSKVLKTFGPIFGCPVAGCKSKFDYKSKLNRHARAVHDINLIGVQNGKLPEIPEKSVIVAPIDNSLQCDHCAERGINFKAMTKDILDIHLKMRHGVRNNINIEATNKNTTSKPVQRQLIAKKKFTARVSDSPSAKRPSTMKCPDCELVLPTASAIIDHLKNPQNKCPECPKHFLFDMDLKRHQELDHAKAFQCPYCPKTFSAQTIYEKHIDNHQKFDVHECEICHEKMTGFATLTSHMEGHAPILRQQLQGQDPEIFGI